MCSLKLALNKVFRMEVASEFKRVMPHAPLFRIVRNKLQNEKLPLRNIAKNKDN